MPSGFTGLPRWQTAGAEMGVSCVIIHLPCPLEARRGLVLPKVISLARPAAMLGALP